MEVCQIPAERMDCGPLIFSERLAFNSPVAETLMLKSSFLTKTSIVLFSVVCADGLK